LNICNSVVVSTFCKRFFSAKLYTDEAGRHLLQRSLIYQPPVSFLCLEWFGRPSDRVPDGSRVTSPAGNGRRELVTSLLMTNAAAAAAAVCEWQANPLVGIQGCDQRFILGRGCSLHPFCSFPFLPLPTLSYCLSSPRMAPELLAKGFEGALLAPPSGKKRHLLPPYTFPEP